MKRKLFTILPLGVILLLVVTNPSVKDFKDHLGKTSYQGLIREHNYFLCSSYVDDSYPADGNHYFAMLGNFFTEEKKPIQYPASADSAKMDSDKIVPDSSKLPIFHK